MVHSETNVPNVDVKIIDGAGVVHRLDASHCFSCGFSKNVIYATDTDVVIIAIAVSSLFENCEIWVGFGHGPPLRCIPCHQLVNELGSDAS